MRWRRYPAYRSCAVDFRQLRTIELQLVALEHVYVCRSVAVLSPRRQVDRFPARPAAGQLQTLTGAPNGAPRSLSERQQ